MHHNMLVVVIDIEYYQLIPQSCLIKYIRGCQCYSVTYGESLFAMVPAELGRMQVMICFDCDQVNICLLYHIYYSHKLFRSI